MAGGAACPGCGQEYMEGVDRCFGCEDYVGQQQWQKRPVHVSRPRPRPPQPDPLQAALERLWRGWVATPPPPAPPEAPAPSKPVKKYRKRRTKPRRPLTADDRRRPPAPEEWARGERRSETTERLAAESRFLDQRNEAAERYFLGVLHRVAPEPDTDPDNWPLIYGRKG